jgi:PAS domain S-box-containing protein
MSKANKPDSGRETILLVDDRPDNLLVMKKVIQKALPQIEIATIEEPGKVMEFLSASDVSAIVSDVQMPDMDGIELCRLIKTSGDTQDIPLILITSHDADPGLRARGLDSGADDFINKPIDNLELVARINVMLRIKRTNDELYYLNAYLDRLVDERTQTIEQYKHIVSSSHDMIAFIDQRYVYLAANPAYLQAFSKTSDELIGRTVGEVFGEEFFKTIIKPRAERCMTGENIRYQEWFDFPSAGRKFMDVIYSAYRGPDMKTRGVVVIARDITELKQTEAELSKHREYLEEIVAERTAQLETRVSESEKLNKAMLNIMEDLEESKKQTEIKSRELLESNKELDAFSYSVSHDLRAPLRHISGFAKILCDSNIDLLNDESKRYLGIIMDSTCKMGSLIDSLLDFSRMGRMKIHKNRIDITGLVRKVAREKQKYLEGRTSEIKVEDLPEVYGDSQLLRQVFVNLIENALKFSSQEAQAEIVIKTVAGQDNEIIIAVRDNGVGFDMKYADKLFGVFQRLHSQNDFEGTGIGLANVNRIINRHGGHVWAEGEVGKGATFYFSLPA